MRNLMDTIATYDSRFTIFWNGDGTYVYNMSYADAHYNLIAPVSEGEDFAWWAYNWKDSDGQLKESQGIMGDYVHDGDFVDWLIMDDVTYENITADTIFPVQPSYPDDADFASADVLYWVGSGANSVVYVVNWADTALAWGYRFAQDSVTVVEILDSLQFYDPRFSYQSAGGYLTDINFVLSDGSTLGVTQGNYFESFTNHVGDIGLFQSLGNGDFHKWADPAAGVPVDSVSYEYDGVAYVYYINVYPMQIYPVSVPQTDGIIAVEQPNTVVYPNPATSMFTVSFGTLEHGTTLALYDVTGRCVATRALEAGSASVSISTAALPNGVYMLRIGSSTSKVVVRD